MRYKFLLLPVISALLFSCKKEKGTYDPPVSLPSPVVPVPTVLLKDVIIARLPNPYYHFEYNAEGNVNFISFASEFTRYDVNYDGGRISEMRNTILVNKDRLQYFYDDAGRVNAIRYVDTFGIVFRKISLTYNGSKLIKLDRETKSGNFIPDKTITMSYYPDGNLSDLTVHFWATTGQPEFIYTDHYEQYDDKLSIENFSLLHDEFFDHFVFLPGVQLQKNNPGKVTHTSANDSYRVNYTYTYNNHEAPLTRNGDLIFTGGPNAGQQFQLSAVYTYY
ncbi:hypothetical protein EFY79_20020 [Hanamia caeni]|jgi:hypothetical protein|uniref:YD repeat-containing protein n=1 Tax=Hanamia caeni TaxID=2294116 RepID=A0A3M9N4P8_9BACT|nr:hypothetical protein [Hanamia caeni]RNI32784.1 hypothetical protein EFY79_20020 [Hanamia caeni]